MTFLRPSRPYAHLAVVCALALAVACAAPAAPPPTPQPQPLTFMAGYKPQANLPFAAAYVAQDLGYFAEQGLDVDIKHSTGQGEHLKLLLQGTVDVTTAASDSVLQRRAEPDVPIVAFALFGQRGDRAFAVLGDSPIRSVKDFEGKIVGYKIYPTPDYVAMLDHAGVDRSSLQEVSVGFDPRILTEGRVDVYPVFVSNEPDLLASIGHPTRLFHPSDYGVATLGLTYITRLELLERDPEMLVRFLKATLRATAAAQGDPEAATDIVMRYAPQESRPHQLSMLKTELEMAHSPITEQYGLGWGTLEQWQALHDSLLQYGGLTSAIDVETAFTTHILEQVYQNGELVWP